MPLPRITRSVSALTGDRRGRLLASVAGGWFLVLGLRFVVPGVLPTITEEFGATGAQSGLAVTVLWVSYATMQFPAGYYADRLGERVLLVAGLLISAGGLLTYAFTPTFALFVIATGVFGLGTGLYGPPRGTAISKAYDEHDGAAFGRRYRTSIRSPRTRDSLPRSTTTHEVRIFQNHRCSPSRPRTAATAHNQSSRCPSRHYSSCDVM